MAHRGEKQNGSHYARGFDRLRPKMSKKDEKAEKIRKHAAKYSRKGY